MVGIYERSGETALKDNYAKVKNNKWASDDDASDLLAGILDETEDDAIAEQARLDAELNAKKEEERIALQSAEESRKQEAASKLSAEMNRLEGVEQKRTEKLQAIEVEELKARGEWIDPEIERRRLEEVRQQEALARAEEQEAAFEDARVPTGHAVNAAVPAAAKSKLPLIILGVLGVLLIVAGVAAATILGGYSADNTSYAKAVFVPKTPEANLVEKSFTATPRKKKAAAVADSSSSKRSKSRKSKSRSRSKSRTKTKSKKRATAPKNLRGKQKQNKASSALEKALKKNNDVYGSSPF